MSESRTFTNSGTLKGLSPTDFDPDWPNGAQVVLPKRVLDLGLDEDQRLNVVESVRLLRELVKDINLFLQRKDMSQQKLAARCNISTNAIRDLQNGEFWPSWGTYGVLRTRVPSALDRANRELEDRIVALQRRIDEDRKRRER